MSGWFLPPDKMGGPGRQFPGCICGQTPCSCNFSGAPIQNQVPDVCAAGPGNEPVSEAQYRCSLAVRTQAVVDLGRRKVHEAGLRPYRVFLVWQERVQGGDFVEYLRFELMPVKILAMDSLDLAASNWGEDITGGVSLSEISPQQIGHEDTLIGYIDNIDWAGKSDRREFFYEIVMYSRCATDPEPQRRRFYPITEPNHDALKFQYTITVGKQKIDRSRESVDQTIGTVDTDGL